MMPALRFACLFLCAALSACGSSPPSRYYLLSAEAEPRAQARAEAMSIGVGPVEVAAYLHHPQLARNSGNQLQLDEFNRWGEDVDAGITRVMAENLALITGADPVVFPWRRDEEPDFALRVSVLRMDRNAERAELVARWSLWRTDENTRIAGDLQRLDAPLARHADPEAAVAAWSELLARLTGLAAAALPDAALSAAARAGAARHE